MSVKTGGCLCGKVRFQVADEPLLAGSCYCRDCQIVSGGDAAHGVLYPMTALTVTSGETRTHSLKSDRGSDVFRQFCPDCGVHLFSQNSGGLDHIAVKIGVFDDPSWFRSQGSVWVGSAQPWHRVDPELPQWETQPDSFET